MKKLIPVLLLGIASALTCIGAPSGTEIRRGGLVTTNGAGTTGQYLATDGTNFYWAEVTATSTNPLPSYVITNAETKAVTFLSNIKAPNILYSNIVYVNASNVSSTINGLYLTNAIKNAPEGTLVVVGPGQYYTPTNTYPSVTMSKDNVSTLWTPGAQWVSGTLGGGSDPAPQWEDSSGARTNCHIFGDGKFYNIDSGGAVVFLENANKMFIQGQVFDFTNNAGLDAGGVFYFTGASELIFDVKDYAACWNYDAIWGSATTGLKVHGRINELIADGDLIELAGDVGNFGDFDLQINTGRVPFSQGHSHWISLPGRAKIRFSDFYISATNATIRTSGTTNSFLEGGSIYLPPGGGVPVIYEQAGDVGTGEQTHFLTLRNISFFCPTNVNFAHLSNNVARAITLENCTIYNGFGSTNWASAYSTNVGYVRIIGNLGLIPYKAKGTNITILGTNYFPAIYNVGNIFSVGGIESEGDLTGVNVTALGTVSALDVSASQYISSGSITPSLVLMNGPDGLFTNVAAGGAGAFLKPDGSSAVPPGGSSSAIGGNNAVQYATNGTDFGGSTAFTFDPTNRFAKIEGLGTTNGFEAALGGNNVRLTPTGLDASVSIGIGVNGAKSGVAPSWTFNNAGHFNPGTDNTSPFIGTAGSGRQVHINAIIVSNRSLTLSGGVIRGTNQIWATNIQSDVIITDSGLLTSVEYELRLTNNTSTITWPGAWLWNDGSTYTDAPTCQRGSYVVKIKIDDNGTNAWLKTGRKFSLAAAGDLALHTNTTTGIITVSNTVAMLGAMQTNTYAATLAVDLDGERHQKCVLTGHITLSTTSRSASLAKLIAMRITASGADRHVTNSSSWTVIGTNSSFFTIPSGKHAMMTLLSDGSAETDVICVYEVAN